MSDPADERQRAFRDAALRWFPDVTRFARSLTRDPASADDLVQETYLRAWRHWDTFHADGDGRAWLFTIARNAWRKQAPRDARLVAVEDDTLHAMVDGLEPLTAPDPVLHALARIDLGPAIRTAIDSLPEAFREIVELIELQQLEYAEAAAVLDVPVGTVRSRLFRARRLLQRALLVHAHDAGLLTEHDSEDQ